MASALLAVAGYHFAFGSTASWDVRAVAATVLFCAGQAAASAASRWSEPAHGADGLSGGILRVARRDGGREAAHFARREAGHGTRLRSAPPHARLAPMLRLLWALLARLLRPLRAPLPVALLRPVPAPRAVRPVRVPALPLLLADAVVRRGPPARPPLAAV
ncbi:hypothetical protein AB0H82_07945 [Streptomyces sp. NPDC050732]|uniref:hypothetical protein n=1 Tax=Streptomyces sp. NPDC050732 TaxID=3154632 RepID=UPI0034366987